MYRLQNALTELYLHFIYFALYRRGTIYSYVQIKCTIKHTFVNKYNYAGSCFLADTQLIVQLQY